MRRGPGNPCYCCTRAAGAFALPACLGSRLVCLSCLLELRETWDLRDLPRPPPEPAQLELPLAWDRPPVRLVEPLPPGPGDWRRTVPNVTAHDRRMLSGRRRTAR